MADKNVKPADDFFTGGFEDATPPKAWVLREEGTIIQGRVLNREERGGRDKGKFFFEIEITEPHNLMVQIGPKEGEPNGHPPQKATKGMVVCLDELARIAFLEDLWGDAEYEWEVKVMFLAKKPHPTERGQTIWVTRNGKKRLGKRQGTK